MSDRNYWLFKSEPDVYGLDDLERDGETYWDGVRNYQARNLLRDEMEAGDLVLYYHSNAKPPGVAGVAEIVKSGYPDPTQFDEASKYHDPKSDPDDPRWFVVDVAYRHRFPTFVSLADLKSDDALDGMMVIRRGMRLSVQPVEERHFRHVVERGGLEPDDVL